MLFEPITGPIDGYVISKNVKHTSAVVSEYGPKGATDIDYRFPWKCTYQAKKDDVLDETEIAERVVFEPKPINPKTFDIEGLGLPPGTRVTYTDIGPRPQIKIWDGEKLIDDPKAKKLIPKKKAAAKD